MIDPTNYNITVRKGLFEGEICFEARIAELPNIAEYADSYEEAYALAIDTIKVTAEMFAERGKPMPAPIIPADDYSGRVTLRLAKSLHRALDRAAKEEGVSLNQHLTNILNYYAGYAQYAQAVSKIENNDYVEQLPSKTEGTVKNRHLSIVSTTKPKVVSQNYDDRKTANGY